MGKQLSCFIQKNNCCLLKLLLPNPLQPSGMMPLSLLLPLLQMMVALPGFPRSHQGTLMLPLVATEISMWGVYRPQLCPWSSSLCSPRLQAQKGITSSCFSLCNIGGWRKISCSVLSPLWTLLHLRRTSLVHPRHQFVLRPFSWEEVWQERIWESSQEPNLPPSTCIYLVLKRCSYFFLAKSECYFILI